MFYKPKLTFQFSKTLSPPKVHENPLGGGAGGLIGKKRGKRVGFKHSGRSIRSTYFTVLNDVVTKN